ncbi:DUF4189 domain-containing protein [Methylobacterium sp. WL18]|uniref:DUF4189 domain-containing protein n=1 Tax=Methylobacterium sp. WL18 TaxID=2603897 RepID=UPI0011C8DA16|nr:DUF4189 domain-containing protein [Methylobacterium sp. WL18]TXN76600.1 DUF4189 domain-containing protein [Methylobacterium sp. WL18]
MAALIALALTPAAAEPKEGDTITFAIEVTDPVPPAREATITVTMGKDASPEVSKAEAIGRCRGGSQHPRNCRVLDSYNHGCSYVATGRNNKGQKGWGQQQTPQAAIDLCRSYGLDCSSRTIGGCTGSD